MHDSPEHEASAFYLRPELLYIVEPVLLWAQQVALDTRIRKMRSFALRIESFFLLSNKRFCHWRAPLLPCLGSGSTRVTFRYLPSWLCCVSTRHGRLKRIPGSMAVA